jgi:hypothetical protein
MSPANEVVVRSLWAQPPTHNHLSGITGFGYEQGVAAEDRLLSELDTIDLHHGPYSTTSPYTTLKVIGAQLTATLRSELSTSGFSTFQQSSEGFIATRSEEDAARLRD